ncbi:CinA family protein [Coxiella-like endosymbiont]|uniref:CinA family protein n=1 Tax=Coxiella-like endosymbiont TaxID=1592897 RepID=UPI00403851DB
MEKEGAVSRAVTCKMAFGVLERSDADIAVGITSIAGPSGGAKKAHRHAVWIVIARKDDGFMECRKVFF